MRVVGFIIGVLFSLTSCQDGIRSESGLVSEVENINKQCPKMLDSETRIDGVELKENNTLQYRYTLVNLNAELLDTNQFRQLMWPGILSTIKLNPSMQKIRDLQAIVQYLYNDGKGKRAYLFTITPDQYK